MLVSGGVDRVLTLYNVTLISDCVDVGEWGRRPCVNIIQCYLNL